MEEKIISLSEKKNRTIKKNKYCKNNNPKLEQMREKIISRDEKKMEVLKKNK